MKILNRIGEVYDRLSDRLKEWLETQVWFQELRTKWEELDAQTQQILRIAGSGALVFILIFFLGIWSWNVRSLKKDLAEKRELLAQLRTAQQEIRKLRDSNQRALGAGASDSWSTYAEKLFAESGITSEHYTLSPEKPLESAEVSPEIAKRNVLEISLKAVNIKQLVKAAVAIENGLRPAKIEKISVDTAPDLTGNLDVHFLISAYQISEGTQ